MGDRGWLLFRVAALGFTFSCRQPPPAIKAADTVEASGDSGRANALLLASAKTALPPPGTTPESLPDPTSQGARLLVTYCRQCHDLPSPATHSATDWPRVVRRMWLRMDRLPASFGIVNADEGSRALLLNYLQANALRISGGELPPGPGRTEFATVCSRCHALPDIRIRSSYDWPTVVARMERNMDQMNVSRPSPIEVQRLLEYLQRVSTR